MRSHPFLAFFLLFIPLEVQGQGSLTPPGPPGPTGKTLEQIEPRIDILRTVNPLPSDASTQIIINAPGSYYLSANLAVAKSNAIQITAAGVTLDLNGFQISRGSGTGGTGIAIAGTGVRAVVRNGQITGFSLGVQCGSAATGGRISDLIVTGCTGSGIVASEAWEITGCRSQDNGLLGIAAGDSARVRDCVARGNGGPGISVGDTSVIDGCIATGNGGTAGIQAGSSAVLSHCVASGNASSSGIAASFGSLLRHCVARNNTSDSTVSQGIFVNGECRIEACVVTGTINTNATASSSTGMGIRVVSNAIIEGCTLHENKGDGLLASSRNQIRNNLCDGNGSGGTGAGIRITSIGNSIDGNQVTYNDVGVAVESGDNIIIRNVSRSNGVAYNFVADNHHGAIINRSGAGTALVNGSAAAGNLTSTDPWANFNY